MGLVCATRLGMVGSHGAGEESVLEDECHAHRGIEAPAACGRLTVLKKCMTKQPAQQNIRVAVLELASVGLTRSARTDGVQSGSAGMWQQHLPTVRGDSLCQLPLGRYTALAVGPEIMRTRRLSRSRACRFITVGGTPASTLVTTLRALGLTAQKMPLAQRFRACRQQPVSTDDCCRIKWRGVGGELARGSAGRTNQPIYAEIDHA